MTLSPGQAQTLQLHVTANMEAQAGSLVLGALAQAQSDNTVRDEDSINVMIEVARAAAARWEPTSLNILSGTKGLANLAIENIGNTATTLDVSLNSIAHVTTTLPFTQVVLPPHRQVTLPINITSDYTRTYQVIATLSGGSAPVQAQLTVNVNGAPRLMYLPLILKRAAPPNEQIYLPLILVLFSGSDRQQCRAPECD